MKKSLVIVTLSIALMGCQSANEQPKPQNTVVQTPPPVQQVQPVVPVQPEIAATSPAAQVQDEAILRSCLKELNALQQVNQAKYQAKSTELNRLLTEAKSYTKIRSSLNGDMSIILDSAFQYRIARTCNDIRVELTRSLLERIERS